MAQSYRIQLQAATARVLPTDDFRHLDRLAPQRWGYFPLAFVWLAQVLSPAATLADRFADARHWLRGLAPTRRLADTYQGFVKALRRRGDSLALLLHTAFQERMRQHLGDDDLVGGWRPLAVDGSRFDCPRSRSCQKSFPRAARKKSPPQLLLTTLWHLGVHCFWDIRIAPAVTAERTLLREMLPHLPRLTLLVGDAGFFGYELCCELHGRGVAFLLRVGANVELLTGLGVVQRENSDTVYLWPRTHRNGPPLVLRLIVVGTGKRRVYLVTNVRSAVALSRKQAADFYRRRWGIETAYRAVKQTLARRKLLSRSSDLAVLELTGLVLGSWMLGLLSLLTRGRRLWRRAWSPARVVHALREALRNLSRAGASLDRRLAAALGPAERSRRRRKRQAWPHRKNDPPCGTPKIRQAAATLAANAQRFTPIND
jgi:hypothetical protein